jgi:hypothetical protein
MSRSRERLARPRHVGTIDHHPATFEVAVSRRGGDAEVLIETVTTPAPVAAHARSIWRDSRRKPPSHSHSPAGRHHRVGIAGDQSRSRETRPRRARGAAWSWITPTRYGGITDDVGSQRDTAPFLKQLASEGALFTRAMTQSTWTRRPLRRS